MNLNFLYTPVSWVLLRWHDLFRLLGFSDTSGLGWALSIVFLVITARLLLFRPFVSQVHHQRDMLRVQPEIAKIREKYKHDRAELNRQMTKLHQEQGVNPLAGCLPLLLQIPVFIGLNHVLLHLAHSARLCNTNTTSSLLTQYTFSRSETCSGARANLFGAPLAASFRDGADKIQQLLGDPAASVASVHAVILPLLLVSALATLLTQLLVRANSTPAPEGTAATVQRLMLWGVPLGVLASGLLFHFPLGVLLYWFTSNLWTLGQQAYVIRVHPPTDPPATPVSSSGPSRAEWSRNSRPLALRSTTRRRKRRGATAAPRLR